MACRVWLPTLGFLVVLSSPALGQRSGRSAADALFREGREAFDKGDYARACPKFADSQNLDPAPGTLLNLAVCEERLGKLVSARRHLTELVPQLAANDDRMPFARDLLAKVDARVAWLTLSLGPGVPPATEIKDEREGQMLPLGSEIPLDPGDHELSVRAPGRPPVQLHVVLNEGQHDTRIIAPPAPKPDASVVAPPPPPPPKAPSSAGSLPPLRLAGYISGGVGVASLGVAVISGAMLLSKKSAVDELCPNKLCSEEGLRRKNEAEKTPLLPLNTASWIIGLVGVGAGVSLILVTREKAPSEPKAAAFVNVLPGGGGLGVQGQF